MPTKIVTAPTSLPITLQEAKDHLRVDGPDEDALILALIKAATDEIENTTWRRFVTQTWKVYFDEFDDFVIPFGQLQSVTHVKYYDSSNVLQTLSSSVYEVDALREPGMVLLATNQSWPTVYSRKNAIEIQFVCGYVTVPHAIKQAVKLKVEELYGNSMPAELESIGKAYNSLVSSYRLY